MDKKIGLILILLVFTIFSSVQAFSIAFCDNGVLEAGEFCDFGGSYNLTNSTYCFNSNQCDSVAAEKICLWEKNAGYNLNYLRNETYACWNGTGFQEDNCFIEGFESSEFLVESYAPGIPNGERYCIQGYCPGGTSFVDGECFDCNYYISDGYDDDTFNWTLSPLFPDNSSRITVGGKIFKDYGPLGEITLVLSNGSDSVSTTFNSNASELNFNIPTPWFVKKNDPTINITLEVSSTNCNESSVISTNVFIQDLDLDGVITAIQAGSDYEPINVYDCDDWPFDDNYHEDVLSGTRLSCPNYNTMMNLTRFYFWDSSKGVSREDFCFNDSRNYGYGKYTHCSFCRNPGMPEQADDIDNDCMGNCQANISRECIIPEYIGDGNSDSSLQSFYNDEGELIGKRGCGGSINSFGVMDNFCQMVDNNIVVNGQVCGGYNRAVKKGEFFVEESTGWLSGFKVYPKISFIPGGLGKDTLIGVSSLGKISPSNRWIYSKALLNESEYLVKKRGTVGIPDNFIDSFRGELYDSFDDFLNLIITPSFSVMGTVDYMRMSDVPGDICDSFATAGVSCGSNSLKVSDLLKTNLWNWETVCVPKDKCNDGVSNSLSRNIFETIPYKAYLPEFETHIHKIGDTPVEQPLPPYLAEVGQRFVDNDAPECKFNDVALLNSDIRGILPTYLSSDYKINSITNQVYCSDDDLDGFCACPIPAIKTMIFSGGSKPPADQIMSEKIISIAGLPDQILIEYCDFDYAKQLGFSVSKSFSDCDDRLGDDSSQYVYSSDVAMAGNQIYATSSLGWDLSSPEYISAWHVHPFSPVTSSSCLFGFDLNCNKDGFSGSLTNLLKVDSPFDFNTNTGSERGSLKKGNDLSRDMVCLDQDILKTLENDLLTVYGGVSLASLIAGGAFMGVGTLFPPSAPFLFPVGATFLTTSAYSSVAATFVSSVALARHIDTISSSGYSFENDDKVRLGFLVLATASIKPTISNSHKQTVNLFSSSQRGKEISLAYTKSRISRVSQKVDSTGNNHAVLSPKFTNPSLSGTGNMVIHGKTHKVLFTSGLPSGVSGAAATPQMGYDFRKAYDVFGYNLAKKAGLDPTKDAFMILSNKILKQNGLTARNFEVIFHEARHLEGGAETAAFLSGQISTIAGKSIKISYVNDLGETITKTYRPDLVQRSLEVFRGSLSPAENALNALVKYPISSGRGYREPLVFFMSTDTGTVDLSPAAIAGILSVPVGVYQLKFVFYDPYFGNSSSSE